MTRTTVVLGLVAIGLVVLGLAVARGLRVPPRLPAVPEESTTKAEIPGIPGARYWVGIDIEPSSGTCSRRASARRG